MRINIGTKIGLGFSVILLLLILLGANSFFSLKSNNGSLGKIVTANNRLILQMEINSQFNAATGYFRGFIAYGDEKFVNQFTKTMDKIITLENELLQVARKERKANVQQLIQITTEYKEIFLNTSVPLTRKHYQALSAGNIAQAQALTKELNKIGSSKTVPLGEEIQKILTSFVEENKAIVNSNLENTLSNGRKVMLISLLISLISILIGTALGIYLTRIIANPIIIAANHAGFIAKGDLSRDVPPSFLQRQDEIGLLAQAFQNITDNFRNLIGQISSTTELVAASSQQLTANVEQSAQAVDQVAGSASLMAQGAEKQLQAVDETSVTVEQMSAGIQQVAANANQVSGIADKTADTAHDGGKAIEAAVNQMDNIERTVIHSAQVVEKLGKRSQEIGEIVDTISAIANQTNLLALNAAIEAARAGEQGRGFAVVAEEVRKLAEDSQEASKQIAQLIKEIQGDTEKAVEAMGKGTQEVKLGTEVVNTAGLSFANISSLIEQVSTQAQEISASIQQIANGSQQIVSAVKQIDQISKNTADQTQATSAATQEQAASMEEIAASSESLAKMAEELQNEVSKFKI